MSQCLILSFSGARNESPRNGKSPNQSNNNKDPFSPATDLRLLLRPATVPEVGVGNEDAGPYNFRLLLRPTDHLPTESLRKRKGFIVGTEEKARKNYISTLAEDSPSKRRAKPVPKNH